MNYIKELNAFREWLLINELPAGAISLWHTLMSINNVARWKKRFNAPNAIVGQLSGLSRQGVLDARNKLIEHHLITCENGRKGKAPIYEMISFFQPVDQSLDSAPDSPIDTSLDTKLDSSLDQSDAQHLNIHKHKQKENKVRRRGEERTSPLPLTYEQNIGKLSPLTLDLFWQWVDKVGEEIMLEAIKLTSKHNGLTFTYLEKILTEWQDAGLATIQAVQDYEREKNSPKNKAIPFRKKLQKGSMFDDLREEIGS